jgi:hypothetical protein
MRQGVEDLLRAYGQSGGPFEKLAAALVPTEMAEPIGERVGDVIAGRYYVLEVLGLGGMGARFKHAREGARRAAVQRSASLNSLVFEQWPGYHP